VFRLAAWGHQLKLFPALVIGHGGALRLREFLRKAFMQGKGSAILEKRAYFGLPLVQRYVTQRKSPEGSWRERILQSLFGLFFSAGHRRGLRFFEAECSTRKMVWLAWCEAWRELVERLKFSVFAEIWAAVESALSLGQKKN